MQPPDRVVCYFNAARIKSQRVLHAFGEGCKACGVDVEWVDACRVSKLLDGAAAWYGVRFAYRHLFVQAQREGRDWYYIDNAFFDDWRGLKFRVGHNCVQMHEFPQRAYPRYSRRVQPWRNSGRNVLICPQSLEFMRITTKLTTNWDTKVFDILRKHTRKPLVFRRKVNGKIDSVKPALADAYAVVTHSSTAAIEALIAGVPAFTTGQESAVWDLTAHDLMQIDAPYYPSVEVRQSRIDAIAAHQWTLDEMARGDAWRALHA